MIDKFGDAAKKTISYHGFVEFMIVLLGDTDTKEETIQSFELINKGKSVVLHEDMTMVMKAYDIEYVEKSATKEGEGYNYHSWTEDMFSR